MKKLLLGLITVFGSYASAQTETPFSVYDCSAYSSPTHAEIINEPNYFRSCVELVDVNDYLFQQNNDILIQANSSIHSTFYDEDSLQMGPFVGEGNMHLKVEPAASPFDVAVMNNMDLNHVVKLKKLELGIQLPGDVYEKIYNFLNNENVLPKDKLNPFVDWDVDVEATFGNGSVTKVVDGFFYRNYQRNTDPEVDDWEEIYTNYPFRIRFSPPATGKWECQINIKIGGVVAYTSINFWFNVIDQGAHGYVKVHDNKRNLELDGRIIMPIGQNFPYPIYNYFVLPGQTHKATRVLGWLKYHDDIKSYHDLGGRYFRTTQGAQASLIEFEEKGNYYNRLHYAWETDKYIQYCDDNDMLVNFNLLFQEPLMNYGQYNTEYWDFSHYKRDSNYNLSYDASDQYPAYCYNDTPPGVLPGQPGFEEPHNMFLDEDDLKYHEQRMRYYIARYGYSTSIMQFELMSESWHLDEFYNEQDGSVGNDNSNSFEWRSTPEGIIVRAALYKYNDRLSKYVKNVLLHTEHLIGLHAFDNSVYWADPVAQTIIDPSLTISTIDVIGTSNYKKEPDKLLNSKSDRGVNFVAGEKSYFQNVWTFWLNSNYKPYMYYEQGIVGDNSTNDCSNYNPHAIDVKSVGFTGCAGFFPWEGFFDHTFDQSIAWPYTVAASKWMNTDKVIDVLSADDGYWFQGRQEAKQFNYQDNETKETQYYVSEDQEKAAGFVYNRNFNYYTTLASSDPYCVLSNPGASFDNLVSIKWDDGTDPLYISGLKSNTDYILKWYKYSDGTEYKTECVNTQADGELKLEFDELTVYQPVENRPMWLYTLAQNNCKSNISNSEPNEEEPLNTKTTNEMIEISPNPFIKNLEIRLEEDAQFEIYSSGYEKVSSGKVSSGNNQLNLEFLSRGVYFLKLSTSDKIYKIVKI